MRGACAGTDSFPTFSRKHPPRLRPCPLGRNLSFRRVIDVVAVIRTQWQLYCWRKRRQHGQTPGMLTTEVVRTLVAASGYITRLISTHRAMCFRDGCERQHHSRADVRKGTRSTDSARTFVLCVTVAFSPTNNIIASCSIDKTVKLWDICIWERNSIPITGLIKPKTRFVSAPDGKRLLGGDDKHPFA